MQDAKMQDAEYRIRKISTALDLLHTPLDCARGLILILQAAPSARPEAVEPCGQGFNTPAPLPFPTTFPT